MLARYLDGEIAPGLQHLGFATETVANPAGAGPMLIAARREPGNRTTVLGYGHGDVIRGLEAEWAEGLSPWRLQRRGDRLYGRGTADNKGQHTINFAALDAVLRTRGRLAVSLPSRLLSRVCEYSPASSESSRHLARGSAIHRDPNGIGWAPTPGNRSGTLG
jgi:acetylornithine deacetylase/succinyl-diaminopimelate desuccinylase-like protein